MLLNRITANEAAGRTNCISHALPLLIIPTPALELLLVVALGTLELLVSDALVDVLLIDVVELLVVELLVAFKLVDDVVEELGAVLIELREKEMTEPSVAAASVVLDEAEVVVEEEPDEEPVEEVADEVVEVAEVVCARTWVNSVAMHRSIAVAAVVGTMRTIFFFLKGYESGGRLPVQLDVDGSSLKFGSSYFDRRRQGISA